MDRPSKRPEVGVVEGQVSTQLVVDDAALSGARHLTVLALRWSEADPLAVALELAPRPDHPSMPRGQWVVLRDFLRYGCSEPTGDGDVRIRPVGRNRLQLALAGGSRPWRVHVATSVVLAFLDDTEAVVPAGSEASDAELDRLIDRLLDC